jgi:hypothetical protein
MKKQHFKAYVMLYTRNLVGELTEMMGTGCSAPIDNRLSTYNKVLEAFEYAKKEDNFRSGVVGFQIRTYNSLNEHKYDTYGKITEIIDFKVFKERHIIEHLKS